MPTLPALVTTILGVVAVERAVKRKLLMTALSEWAAAVVPNAPRVSPVNVVVVIPV